MVEVSGELGVQVGGPGGVTGVAVRGSEDLQRVARGRVVVTKEVAQGSVAVGGPGNSGRGVLGREQKLRVEDGGGGGRLVACGGARSVGIDLE